MPVISVITPVYNTKEEYLRPAIESILNQTYSDFEFILIDDGSKPYIRDIICSYPDERIKYISNLKNQGAAKSRNLGIEMSAGEYIAFIDSDDAAYPDRFSKQLSYLKAHPEVDCLGTSYRIIPANAVMHKSENNHDTLKYYTLFQGCPFCQSTVMMRRRVFEETGVRYETRFVPTEDYALWIELCDRCRFANLDEVLLDYRVHDSNISILKAEEQSRNGNLAQYDKIFRMAGVEDPHLAEIFTEFFQFEHLTKQEFAEVERRIPEIISFFASQGWNYARLKKLFAGKIRRVLRKTKSPALRNALLKSNMLKILGISNWFKFKIFLTKKTKEYAE